MEYEKAVMLHEQAKEYGSILGLDAIRNLMKELKDVWKDLNIVHIAGTNGKGSVSCFLASVLKEAGYCVGQYNSPAVFDLREVYKINGSEISKEEYADCMEQVNAACNQLVQEGKPHPTVFEMETAIAFLWFYQRNCDIVLLETGMGGSTDATNLIESPLCSVLMSVAMDHMQFLGDSLKEIATVKAGIIKPNSPVIAAPQSLEVETVFREKANHLQAPYIQTHPMDEYRIENEELCYEYPKVGTIRLSMRGSYQVENSAVAIETVFVLKDRGYSISLEQLKQGLHKAKWQGRFECLNQLPLFYIDGAHNVQGAMRLRESLEMNFPAYKRIGIMGCMADKAYGQMLDELLPLFEKVYVVTPNHPRALTGSELEKEIKSRGGDAVCTETIKQAVEQAKKEAEECPKEAMVVAFGSLYYLKEVKDALSS